MDVSPHQPRPSLSVSDSILPATVTLSFSVYSLLSSFCSCVVNCYVFMFLCFYATVLWTNKHDDDDDNSSRLYLYVCLSVCLFVCLSACLSVRQNISGTTHTIFTKFCACCLCPWLGPPPAGWRNFNGKGKFWGFSSPLTMHCNAFAANNVMQQQNGPFRRCREGGHGSALQHGRSVIYDCLVPGFKLASFTNPPCHDSFLHRPHSTDY